MDGNDSVNREFHTHVHTIAANRWLDRAIDALRRFMRLWHGRQLNRPRRMEETIQEQRAFIDAFVKRGVAHAERGMHGHLMAPPAARQAWRRHERTLGARRA
ncbi:MAG: FCD domain-containing protein [Burkholderiaceae bacterium]